LIAELTAATREWIVSDDPIATKKRELAILKFRAQYWLLDPYIRGRGAYHRNGNVSHALDTSKSCL
jgi:hypothetical protein